MGFQKGYHLALVEGDEQPRLSEDPRISNETIMSLSLLVSTPRYLEM